MSQRSVQAPPCPNVNGSSLTFAITTAIILLLIPAAATAQPCTAARLHYQLSAVCSDTLSIQPDTLQPALGTFLIPIGLSVDTATGHIIVAGSIPATYTLRYVAADTCHDTASFTLTIHPAPDPAFGYPNPICMAGPNPQPTGIATQGGTFSIYPGTATINPATGSISLATAQAGTYIITHTVSLSYPPQLSCTATELKPVQVTPPAPSTFYYPDTAACATGTLSPVLTGLGGGQWYSIPAGLSLNQATGQINLAASSIGTYTISYTSPGLCQSTDTFRLAVHQPATALFSYTPASFCIGAAADPTPNILADSGGTFRAVHGPATVDSLTGRIHLAQSQPSDSIIIRYVVRSSSGGSSWSSGAETCADSLDFLVRITAPDTGITLTYDNAQYCQSYTDPFPQLSGTQGTGGSFAATPPGLAFTSPFTGQVDLSASLPGTYLIRYYPQGSCTDSTAGHYLTILPTDRLSFAFPPTACTADSTAQPTGLADTLGTFQEPSGALAFTDPHRGTIDLTQSQPGIYAIHYTSGGGCKADTTLSFALYPSPQPEILAVGERSRTTADNTFCEGDTIQFLAFGGDRYEWRVNGAIDQPLQPLPTYTPGFPLQDGDLVQLTAQNVNGGCTEQDQVVVKMVGTPRLTLLDHPTTVAGAEPVAVVLLAGQDSTTVWWRRDDNSGQPTEGVSKLLRDGEAFILTDSLPQTTGWSSGAETPRGVSPSQRQYSIVPKVGSCAADTLNTQITRLPDESPFLIPSIVTPNGDGHNDTWKFMLRDGLNPGEYTLTLLNRAGGTVWQTPTLATEWTPTAPDGIYYWTLTRTADQKPIQNGGLTIRSR